METQIPHSPNHNSSARVNAPAKNKIQAEIEDLRHTGYDCESKRQFYEQYDRFTQEEKDFFFK